MVAIAKTAQTAVTLLVISVSYKESNNRFLFRISDILHLLHPVLSHSGRMEPRSAGDVLSAPFDLR